MHTRHWPHRPALRRLVFAFALSAVAFTAGAVRNHDNDGRNPGLRLPDHYEFDATLDAAFRPDATGAHALRLAFDYPGGGEATVATWQLDLLSARGAVLRRWIGEAPLSNGRGAYALAWDGRDARGAAVAPGFYTARLRAVPSVRVDSERDLALLERARRSFALGRAELIEQAMDLRVGDVDAPRMPAFAGLSHAGRPVAASKGGANVGIAAVPASTLPYTIYYGNLHSQTNHSDGGVAPASCNGAETPQAGTYGPADAYAMMQNQAGGDFLLTSEHNHMYDGSTGTNTAASPATANNLFNSGIAAAANYRSAHPTFLALYGNEWGVISNGGHLNLINPDGLAEWEYNASGQLIGSVATIKSDYANLYSVMKARGWIGQFNHPASSGQFLVGGTALGYDANGNDVMVLAEVLNSSAFSTNMTQTETSRSTYTGAFNILLERGYHVAPSSDQDNHCANWGLSFRNRTGVLLPNGVALTVANFLDALKARRVFATEDKAAQVVLTGNGLVMGQTISNSGVLSLAANYASSNGQAASRVQFFEGVPGRNGTVTQLFEGAGTYAFTPSQGAHFYYVLVTQSDGDRIWSAPIWVNQGTGTPSDTTPPTVSASESGSSGTITLSATAADNVGVANVAFYVDGALKGSDASSPYALPLDSTTLANASHTLTARAYDAAGNSTTSAGVAFTVNNSASTQFNEVESNGTAGTANAVAHSYKTIVGTMGNTTDKDYFALALAANETVKLDMAGGASGSDYDLYLVTAADATLKSSTGSTSTETVSYTNGASAATVYAKVIAYAGSGTTPYTLTLTYTAGSGGGATELVGNGGFESGSAPWTTTSGVIDNSTSQAAHSGSWKAWMDGYGAAHTDSVLQTVVIPAAAPSATLGFWLKVVSSETTTTTAYDTLKVQVRNTSGTVLATLATYSNLNKGSTYLQKSFDLSAWKGQTVQLYFLGVEGSTVATSFLLDDVSLK
jgi:hypothetical protein